MSDTNKKYAQFDSNGLPVGFYDVVAKSGGPNLKHLAMVAKSRKLECTVE